MHLNRCLEEQSRIVDILIKIAAGSKEVVMPPIDLQTESPEVSPAPKKSGSGMLILIVIVLIVIAAIVFFIMKNKSSASPASNLYGNSTTQSDSSSSTQVTVASGKEVYDCKFTGTSSVATVSGYNAKVFSSANVDVGVGVTRPETSTSNYKLKDFTATSKPSETVFSTVYGNGEAFIPGVSTMLQICNASTNKSTSFIPLDQYTTSQTSANSSGVEISMSFIDVPDKPGKYRVDGLMKINDGDWQLVGRKNIEFK
jgi:hypothetical protein